MGGSGRSSDIVSLRDTLGFREQKESRWRRWKWRVAIALTIQAIMVGAAIGTAYVGSSATLTTNTAFVKVTPQWQQLSPASSPSPRAGFSMAYDAVDGYVLLFGGYGGSYDGDTWKYQGGVWTELETADIGTTCYTNPPTDTTTGPCPSPRYIASMAFSAKDGAVILYGGYSGTSTLSDTWAWSLGAWFQLTTTGNPPALQNAAMVSMAGQPSAYWSCGGGVMLYGGYDGTADTGQTWCLWYNSGAATPSWTWGKACYTTSATAPCGPGDMEGEGIVNDYSTGRNILFGGYQSGTDIQNTWKFYCNSCSTSYWYESATTGPAIRDGMGFAYDFGDGYPLLFGGDSDNAGSCSTLQDTWKVTGGNTWTQITTGGTPPPARAYFSMVYDKYDGYILLFGGATEASTCGFSTYFGDTWIYGYPR